MYANAIDAKVLNASALNHGWSLDFCLLMNVIARVSATKFSTNILTILLE